jgi:hypothetical protein
MRRVYVALLAIALALPLGILASGSAQAVARAVIIGAFTCGATLFFALPLSLCFIRKGWLRAWQAVLAGGMTGILLATLFALDPLARPAGEVFVRFALVGALHGAAFWLLAIYRNQYLQVRLVNAATAGS